MAALRVEIDQELIEQIAERAAELVGERTQAKGPDGWLRGADRIAAYIDAPARASMRSSRLGVSRSTTTALR
jgi:hypothetical protein